MARFTVPTLAALAVLAIPGIAQSAPIGVDVRVEGLSQTVFSGPVFTDIKPVVAPDSVTQQSAPRTCDGTNNGAGGVPAPTGTNALDDASRAGGFTWDRTYYQSFDDMTVDRIGPDASDNVNFRYWGFFVNGVYSQTGGCQARVRAGDEVLWAYDAFNKTGLARISGDGAATTGAPATLRATDTLSGAPLAGATIGGKLTDAQGFAQVSFASPGIYDLRAERGDYVRSKPLRLCVDPPGIDPCVSTDRTAPTARAGAPAIASDYGRFGYVKVAWQGFDGNGSGVQRYNVTQRRLDGRGSERTAVAIDTRALEKVVPGHPGGAHEYSVVATDRAGNHSRPVTTRTLVPLDNLSHRLRFSRRGWTVRKRQGAYQLAVSRSRRRGASVRVRFNGTQAVLVTRRLRFGGRARITVDGRHARTVNLRGRSRFRTVKVASRAVRPGRHTLRITALGRRPIEIDAIAIRN